MGFFSRFNPIKAIQRAVTITPKSFTPANIARSAGAVGVAAVTGGAGVALLQGATLATPGGQAGLNIFGQPGAVNPFSVTSGVAATQAKVTVEGIPITSGTSTHETSLAQAAGTGFYSFGQVRSGNPAIPETLFDRIARTIGGAAAAVGATKGITSALSPYTGGSKAAVLSSNAIQTTGTGFATSQFAQGVLGLFGQKIGGTILSLLSGDVGQAIQIFTTNPPDGRGSSPEALLFGPSSGGGGGGGGFFPSRNTGQALTNRAIVPVLGVIAVIVVIWWMKRK